MIKEIKIPNIGENVEEGTVVEIKVSKGDMVEQDQTIIEFETDKALVEIPAPEAGKISEISVSKGDTLKIGDVVGKIDTEAEKETAENGQEKEARAEGNEKPEIEEKEDEKQLKQEKQQKKPEPRRETKPEPKEEKEEIDSKPVEEPKEEPEEERRKGEPAPAAPSVRRLARELGASIDDIKGSGPGGRITFDDVKGHVKEIVMASKGAAGPSVGPGRPMPDFSKWGDIETEQMSRVRSVISRHVTNAWQTIPHVTQFEKADITTVEKFRSDFGKQLEKQGAKLTITAILLNICAKALVRFPRFNASIDPDNEQIIIKKYCNIGIATDTERGLLVPVLRDVDKMSILELAVKLHETAEKTRDGKLTPDDMEGGTFTISNQGSIGGVDFTPIISWPQVAILGVSRGSVQPVYIDGEFQPRTVLPLSLSYDHRIIDGADAARFLKWIKDALEQPLLLNYE